MTPDPDVPEFTYPDVGATYPGHPLPSGYRHFRRRARVGTGRDDFRRAGDAVLAYRMQRGAGIFGAADTPTAEIGTRVTVRLGVGALAVAAPARVVYLLDDPDRQVRGFAYGTLPGHPLAGEELFAVQYEPATDAVYGLVTSFSKGARGYSRAAQPVIVLLQRLIAARYLAALRH